MASPGWMFLLTDLSGNVIGEVLKASQVKVILPLKDTPTCSFTVPNTHPLANYFTDPDWDGLVKGYRNGVLRFCGPLVSGQEAGDTANPSTIQVNASGAFWRLNYRLAGIAVSSGGTIAPLTYGSQVSPIDLGQIAFNLIDYANAEGYTGIDKNTLTASGNGAAGPYVLAPIGDAIKALASTGTFDWEVVPTEPTNVGQSWPRIGLFNCVPLIGQTESNVVFEFGTGQANILSYSNTVDRSGLATMGYMQQPAVTDYSDTLIVEDTTATATRGRFIAAVDSGGVQYDVFRAVLLAENVAVRKRARQVVNFIPRAGANFQPLVDYFVGDQVRARVVSNGQLRLDAYMRVWGIQFDVDQNGNETPTLQLTQT